MRPAGVFVSGYCGGTGLVPSPGNNGTSKGSPEMAQKRRRARGVPPTWRKNDVGPEAFPRHGAKTTSGQRRFPDMAQKRRRVRGVSPTWHRNDVGSHDDNPCRSPAQPQKNTRSTERVFSQNP